MSVDVAFRSTVKKLSLAALLILSLAPPAHSAIPDTERVVLDALYAQTDGAHWTHSEGWAGAVGTECGWYGITCDVAQTTVQQINLSANNLRGSLISATGTVDLTRLPNLEVFDISSTYPNYNNVSGALPPVSGLVRLRRLDLGGNHLGGVFPSLAGLTSLQRLDIAANQFSDPAPSISGLSTLQYVDLSYNGFRASLPELDNLPNLEHFAASFNSFSGPIPTLLGLDNLQYLDLSFNKLSGSIPPLSALPNLQTFIVTDAGISGSAPSLAGLAKLEYFDVGGTSLTGQFPSLDGLSSLRVISIGTGGLIGSLPAAPPTLTAGMSNICPNHLTRKPDAGWDTATGVTPWYTACPFRVTPNAGPNGSISPAQPVDVLNTGSTTFTVTPDPGYRAQIDGTCLHSEFDTGKGLEVDVGPVTSDCAVAASFSLIPTLAVTSSSNPSGLNEPITFTATIRGADPSGRVFWLGQDASLCESTPVMGDNSHASATCAVVFPQPGSYPISVAYQDATIVDAIRVGIVQSAFGTVSATSSTSVPNPSVASQSVTLLASVTGTSPTGTVRFFDNRPDGLLEICNVSLGSNGSASCSVSNLSQGTHALIQTYSGDKNNTYSQSYLTQTVNAPTLSTPTTTALTSSVNPSTENASVVLTATVAGNSPTGTVTFLDHDVSLCGTVLLQGVGDAPSASCAFASWTTGAHEIIALYSGDSANGASVSTGVSQFVVTSTPVNLDQFGLTGAWFNPATSGQGIVVEALPDIAGVGNGVLFGGWFTFDTAASGGQRWYTIQGSVNTEDTFASLPIYVNYGGVFNAPPSIKPVPVGLARLQFSDCVHGVLSYRFSDGSGRSGNIPLSRLDANVTCTPHGDSSAPASNYPLSGGWYDPATSGQGLLFGINPAQNVLFGAWYTFSQTALNAGVGQRWYTLQVGGFTPSASSMKNVPIYSTSGGVFDAPIKASPIQVGTGDITFQTCNAMTLAYAFATGENQGRSGTIRLVRAGPTPPGCSM